MNNTGKLFNFIQFSEINEADENLPVPAAEPQAETPTPNAAELPEPTTDAAGEEDAEGADEFEGGPQIIKVYTDSEEDLQELRDAGIELPGEGEASVEGGEEGAEPEAAEDVLYIKIQTEDGEDIILPFKEESEENRVPVEGEENTFDTDLIANHNDYEYKITAEIKVNPVTGEEETPEVDTDAPVEEEPAEEGVEGEEAPAEEPAVPNESFAFENKIFSFTQFVNENKREIERAKKAKEWKDAIKDGKKKFKKKK